MLPGETAVSEGLDTLALHPPPLPPSLLLIWHGVWELLVMICDRRRCLRSPWIIRRPTARSSTVSVRLSVEICFVFECPVSCQVRGRSHQVLPPRAKHTCSSTGMISAREHLVALMQ